MRRTTKRKAKRAAITVGGAFTGSYIGSKGPGGGRGGAAVGAFLGGSAAQQYAGKRYPRLGRPPKAGTHATKKHGSTQEVKYKARAKRKGR